MHISSCEHPKRIKNPYTGEEMFVPCGHCNTCLNKRSRVWVQRLEQEIRCHKYTAFVTLTYDETNLPRLRVIDNCFLVDTSALHRPSGADSLFIDLKELDEVYNFTEKDWDFLAVRQYLPYLSVYDVQCFVKRLRINLSRNGFKEKIRYYICGEYGPTTFRPHYHCLFFFDEDSTSTAFNSMLSASWKLGHFDFSFATSDAARYVAKYVNCFSHLPSFYRYRFIRPFAVQSRRPPLGTLFSNSDEMREVFFSAAPKRILFDQGSNRLRLVPQWRSVVDRLYPRISRFDALSYLDRVTLYRIADSCGKETFDEFLWFAKNRKFKNEFVNRHLDSISNGYTLMSPLHQIWFCSKRVCFQCKIWNIDVKTYVDVITQFYNNVSMDKLHNLYEFAEDYSSGYDVRGLLGVNSLFLDDCRDCNLEDLSVGEIAALESYGVDTSKFFSSDLDVREEYQRYFLPENTADFEQMVINNKAILDNSMKTKRKNDYLSSLPEERQLLYNFNF